MSTAPKILVIDDSRTVRVQVQRALAAAGYDVLLAGEGAEGIALAVHQRPELIVLDIQMPGIDGYRVCQELDRFGPPWDKLPIVFLSSLESHALQLLGRELGAYLRKPVCPEKLLDAVHQFLTPGSGSDCEHPGDSAAAVRAMPR